MNYPIHDELKANAVLNCAALVITERWSESVSGLLAPAVPSAGLCNATLTFVRHAGRAYGITCQHVIDELRSLNAASGSPVSYTLRTMLKGFFDVQDRFVQPSATIEGGKPDIAIREFNPKFVEHLGKKCIELDGAHEPPTEIRHGYAVGFPEHLKYEKPDDENRTRISMPHVEALLEFERRPNHRFAMRSELDKPPPEVEFSGMSGGPIYWSTEKEFGILGIVYEGGSSALSNSISIFGEFATPDVIRRWLAEIPTIFP